MVSYTRLMRLVVTMVSIRLSVAGAYSAFANGGYYIEPHTVTKIKFDESGKAEDV